MELRWHENSTKKEKGQSQERKDEENEGKKSETRALCTLSLRQDLTFCVPYIVIYLRHQ